MANPRDQIISDPGGSAFQTVPFTPEPQVVNITQVDRQPNPWATPTAYRAPTDQFIGADVAPELQNSRYQANGSQYAPAVVTPAGTPTYVHGPVVDPTPIVPVPNTGA